MPPDDPTPLGDAMTHRFPDQKIPQPQPDPAGTAGVKSERGTAASRPTLPDHPERMAADIEDEDADPVVDSGPGIADGIKGLKKQRG